jgi:hypothetical protein
VSETVMSSGSGPGQVSNPQGICFDPSGNVYVADWANVNDQKLLSCSSLFSPAPTPTPANIYSLRLDSGSQNFIDPSNNIWLADQAYVSGGSGYTQGGQLETSGTTVTGTNSSSLYQTFREGSQLAYSFTLPAGHYQITLKFADLISTAAGQNVFNITEDGTEVSNNVDIYKTMGGGVATDRSFRVDVTGSSPLTVQLTAVKGDAFLSGIEVTGLQTNTGAGLDIYLVGPGGPSLLP